MDEEREEGGISIGDIFRTILSQKWLALILAAAITVVGTICFYLMGKSDEVYSVEYFLSLPGSDDSPLSYRYPDGKNFSYTDYVSLEVLKEVKASNKDFENIDVEKMVQSGDIIIARDLTETAEGTKEYAPSYKLTVKSKYFKDGNVARDFIVALAESPVAHISEMNINYDYNITASRNALTYDGQLTELEHQVQALQNLYNSFIAAYGGDFKVELEGQSDPVSLAKLKSDSVDEYLSKGLFTTLKREAYDNGYVKTTTDTRERDKYVSEKKALEEKLKIAKNTLNKLLDLQANSSGSIIYSDSIRAQIIEVEQLTVELEEHTQKYLNNFDNGVVSSEFDAKVKAVEAEVTQLTEDIKPVASYVYGKVAEVNIPKADKITAEGGNGILKSGLISLVAGIVVALVVAYIVGWNAQKKAKNATENVSEISAFAEVQAQAAATDLSEDAADVEGETVSEDQTEAVSEQEDKNSDK